MADPLALSVRPPQPYQSPGQDYQSHGDGHGADFVAARGLSLSHSLYIYIYMYIIYIHTFTYLHLSSYLSAYVNVCISN